MATLSTIELFKEIMKFSAGHFTIFSATERENLHGHNYTVHVAITALIGKNGLNFDYREYKEQVTALCEKLNQTFLLPTQSPHLKLEETNDFYIAYFNQEKIPFLKRDVTLLPLTNITVEELSRWFIQQLITNKEQLAQHVIQEITVKVSNSPGLSGSAHWKCN